MIIDGLICAILSYLIMRVIRHWQKPLIWIIEDSPIEIIYYQSNFRLQDYNVKYYTSAEMAVKDLLKLKQPKAVIVDYLLGNNIKGDEVVKFCDFHGIETILITQYDGEIKGIPEKRVYRKSLDDSFFRRIESWLHQATGN